MMRWQVGSRAATGAGKLAVSSEPSGAETSATSMTPWLLGQSGSSIACNPKTQAATVAFMVTLMLPVTWGEVPVKSKWMRSPATVASSRIGMLVVPRPSLSIPSSKR